MKRLYSLLILWVSLSLSAQDSITLLFVGDLMQHKEQILTAQKEEGYDYSPCFQYVQKEISNADLAFANLEVTLGGKPYSGYPAFSAPDEFLYAVKDAGFNVLLTANNHCLDKGKKGLERTIVLLDSLQIPHAGTYINEEQRKQDYPLLIEKKGFRIVFLNYTYETNGKEPNAPNIVNYIDKDWIKKDILAARHIRPDVIIACMHWGTEYRSLPEQSERELADWLIAQGVDHVIGSHPHVLQPMEIQQDPHTPSDHVVVYSLGNFISNMSKENTDGGAMVKLELRRILPGIIRLKDCRYALVWTSRPALNKQNNYVLYPSTFLHQSIPNEELNVMKRFLENSRKLLETYNKGVEEYFFE